MTKIAFVSTIGSAWGGSEELWSQAALRLVNSGMTVGVHTWRRSPPVPQIEALAQADCHIKRSRLPGRLTRFLGIRADRWLDAFAPDLAVISQAAHDQGVDWMRACAARKIPYAVVVQCAAEIWWPEDEAALALAEALEGAAACFYVSGRNLELVRRQLATPLLHARVIRNPFNVSYDASPAWPSEEGLWRLACVARLEPRAKGQDLLFDVLRQEKWRQRPVELSLIGSGPSRGTLQKLARMHGLNNVSFGGFVSDIEAVWRQHHALVLPSRFEGLPLALVEAMLCGRPSIVTDVAGNTELVEDGVTGFVAEAPDVCCLDAAMERAWTRRAEWAQIGQAAARRVRQAVPRDPIGAFVSELTALR